MALVIPTNTPSLMAQKHLSATQRALQSSFDKLSSGFRIVTAKDDAAGLAISESMKSQIRSYTVAERNAADAISMAQTAEGSLGEVNDILLRMRELAMQSANGSMTSTDRTYINEEFGSLKDEIQRIQGSAKFNGKQLLQSTANQIQFQVGLNNTSVDQIDITFGGIGFSSILAASSTLGGTTASSALAALSRIDSTMTVVSTARARYGSAMNRLEVATSNIQTMRVNLQAANSRIRDVDVAEESATLSRNQVLSQAGVSVLAQANQLPQSALGLIGR